MDNHPTKEKTDGDVEALAANDLTHTQSVQNGVVASPKGRWERTWPVLAAGAGLFSDGYLNNVGTFSFRKRDTHSLVVPLGDWIR